MQLGSWSVSHPRCSWPGVAFVEWRLGCSVSQCKGTVSWWISVWLIVLVFPLKVTWLWLWSDCRATSHSNFQNTRSISVEHGSESSVDHNGTVPHDATSSSYLPFDSFCDLMQVCQVDPSGSKSQGRVLRAQARYEAFEFTTPSRLASLSALSSLIKKIR